MKAYFSAGKDQKKADGGPDIDGKRIEKKYKN
jgi:hypothetical protein